MYWYKDLSLTMDFGIIVDKMLLLRLASIFLLPYLCTACTEGMACNSSSVVGGVCVRGTCLASIPSMPRENLSFNVTIRYPETSLTMHGGSKLYIRGNGLGLSWDKGTVIPKTSTDTWKINISYTSSLDGYRCQTCADKHPLQGNKFEYRVFVDDRVDMLGGNFAVKLPMSKVSNYFSNKREVFSYPWFYQKSGNISTTIVDSSDLGGNRSITLYKPPSFYENVHKVYPVIFALDYDTKIFNVPQNMFDDPITKFGVTEEFIVIGFADYNATERTPFLTPSEHEYFGCKNGTFADSCDGCFSASDITDRYAFFSLMLHKCGKLVPVGGKGNAVIEFLLHKVLPTVKTLYNNRLTTDRENVGIIGYSLGGLMACHAAWTRPRDFGFAACQSSSFWWPLQFDKRNDTVTAGFEFLNQTLLNVSLNMDRPQQRIYLDAGTLENYSPYRMADAAVEAAEKITKMNGYVLDKNVWVNVYPGAVHAFLEWKLRMWKALKTLLPSKGMPSMPHNTSPSLVG